MKYPLVLVEWEDAAEIDSSPWVDLDSVDEEPKPHLVRQVGYLLSQTQTRVILTHALGDNNTAARREQIPTGMVRSITFLKQGTNGNSKLRRSKTQVPGQHGTETDPQSV